MNQEQQRVGAFDRLETWASRHTNLIAIIAAIGSVLSGGALITALISLSDARASADAQSYAAVSGIWHEHMAMFIEHPELRPYFFDRKTLIQGDKNTDAVQAMADVRLDAMDRMLWTADMANWSGEEVAGWGRLFARAFSSSPALCAVWPQVREDYPKLRRIGDGSCNAIAQP